MVNWDADDIVKFKGEARDSQQEYCDLLGDRQFDEIESWKWTILRRKVGFGIYGPPRFEPNEDNWQTGYTKTELNVIEKICDQLVEDFDFKNRNVHCACIFVVVKVNDKKYTVPVFKAKRDIADSFSCIFVDTGARKYSNWNDYLEKNTLEKCIYCYPTRGLYERNNDNRVCVSFGTSPACDFKNRVTSFLDMASSAVALTTTCVGVASLCTIPIAGPIMAATAISGVSTSVYGVARSAFALRDRAQHSQSIGLTDSEARGCWLSIVGSSLGFAQGKMISSMTKLARTGEVMSKAGRIAFLVVQTGSLTANGLGIVHGFATLIEKNEREELTSLDVFQFTASLLFFSNTVINLKTASTIIKEVQHDIIQTHRQPLDEDAKKLFNKQTGKLRGPREMHGNAEVVKQLNRIQNSTDLYEMMSNRNVVNNKVKLTNDGFKGLLEVNKNLKIHPLKLVQIPPESRQAIFDSTKKYANGALTKTEFHNEMKTYCRKHQIAFESMRKETLTKLCEIYGQTEINKIEVGGKKIFANATPHEVDRLRVVLENTAQNNKTIIEMATEFAKTKGCSSTKEFISYVEYFVADLNETVKSYENKYHADLKVAKNQPDFKQNQFDQNRGIKGSRTAYHRQKALDKFKNREGYDDLNRRYENLKSKVAPLNQECQPGFFSADAATCHYLKHKDFGKSGTLTPEQYFKLAEEVVGNPTNKTNSMLSQDGSCVIITYIKPQCGVRAIKIDRQDESGIATVMYDKKVHSKN